MMRLNWKSSLALILAVSMIQSSVPIQAQTVKSDVMKKSVQKVTEKEKTESKKSYVEGEAIILYKSNTSTANKIRSSKVLGKDIEVKETYNFESQKSNGTKSKSTEGTGISVSLVKSDKYSTQELIKVLKKRSDIKYAEPNYRIKAMDTKDPYEKYQWALENIGQNGGTPGLDINADALKKSVDDKEKVIALIDTGIDYTHEELQNVIWNNPVNSKQLKGEHGYDFINYDTDPLDDNGHGTHCSGIMAAASGNGVGGAGVAKSSNIKIMGLKILDEEGYGYGMEAVGAYNYVYKAQQLGVNVVAVNNSWGAEGDGDEDSEDSESHILLEVINMVGKAGALSVCAAGNDGADNTVMNNIPTNLDSPYIISVAASNENDELAAFSNYGDNVDIAAPGTDILSTVSYNTFNPVLYDDKDDFCSVYQNFETGNLVSVMNNGKMTDTAAGTGDIAYGLDSDDAGDMEISVDNNTYFGMKSDGTKSVKWTIEGAEQGGVYTLYFPYDAEVSSTPLYSSVMAKVSGPSRAGEDFFGMDSSILYVSDGSFDQNGYYDEDGETFISGSYIDEGNYWNLCTGEAVERVKKKHQRAIAIQVEAGADGDYTVYIDKMAVSKSNIDADTFGKYDFYNGTSMATPFVTGAVAAVADSFSDGNALERKARILGSVRKNDALTSKVKAGGVLDLSKAESPSMLIEGAVLNDKKQIKITGYHLSDAKIKVNGSNVTAIENSDSTVIIDGKDYLNKSINIEIEKGEDYFTKTYFFMSGKKFNSEEKVDGYLDGGSVVSGGENLYYVDNNGFVSVGTPIEDSAEIEWVEYEHTYSPSVFGDAYNTAVDYTITNSSGPVCLNRTLYTVLSIDVGYSEDTVIAYYDEKNGWKKYIDIPEEFADFIGVTLASYNGKIYLIGGLDQEKGICSKHVSYYDEGKKAWIPATELPEGRCFSKAVQVGNKLVLTLGGNGINSEIKNLIFDGNKWTISKAEMGTIVGVEDYFYETEVTEAFPVYSAQVGLVKDGIVYTDLKVEGVGDTFIYNLKNDRYTSTGYCLNRDSLDGDTLLATTVQNKLYVIYGWGYVEDDFDFDFFKNKKSDYNYIPGLDFEDDYSINVCTMPIENGFIRVQDISISMAYVFGEGYYLPGDTVRLVAETLEDYYITSFVVDGKKINADSKGVYAYTIKVDGSKQNIKAKADAGAYVSEIYLSEDMITLEKSSNAKKNSCYLYAEMFPGDAANSKVIWSTSNAKVATVDSYGKVTVAKNAKADQMAIIRATAADRKTVYAECIVFISKSTITKNSKHKVGSFTYKVTNFSSKTKTVTCVSLNKKGATKATVPATVKIDGYTFKVTGISANAFKNCKKLKSVIVGKNVTSIGKNVWSGCKKLSKVTIKSSKIKKFGKGLFKGTSKKLTVKVPKKVKKSYSKKLKKAGFKGKVK